LTSNPKRSKVPGNVTLNKGEANLPKKSVVNISQIFTVNKSNLSEKNGTLPKQRIAQISDGVRLLTEPREIKFGLFCSKKSDKDWGFPISIFLKLSENPQNTKIRYNPIAATARCKEEQ